MSGEPFVNFSAASFSAADRLEPSPSRASRKLQQAQEQIYEYLLSIVKSWMPDEVLAEFRCLFICHADAKDPEVQSCLYQIILQNQAQEFRHTLKRSCYILINNWDIRRNYELIQQLIGLFADPVLDRPTISPTLKRLRGWLREFSASEDFQELKLYAERYDPQRQHWTHHFASYLLVSQYANPENSIDQRQAARRLSGYLREQFKFDLARYTALSQCPSVPARQLRNPTGLGDRVLHLIKRIVLRRGLFSYPNIARIFLSQTQGLSFQAFKPCLLSYLIFGIDHPQFVPTLQEFLAEKLSRLYCDRDGQPVTDALLLRTAKRLIDYLLTENGQEPSPLFVLLLSRGNALLLVIVLLKIVLLCRHVRVHLETRIAEIIRYYEQCPEQDCRWVIDFLEILHVTLTVHTENVQYTLVNMDYAQPRAAVYPATPTNLETYRIFSQRHSRQAWLQSSQHSFSQVALAPVLSSPPTLAPDLPAEVLSGQAGGYAVQPVEQDITPA